MDNLEEAKKIGSKVSVHKGQHKGKTGYVRSVIKGRFGAPSERRLDIDFEDGSQGVVDKQHTKAVKESTKMKTFSQIREGRGGTGEVGEGHIIMQLRKAQDVDGNHPIKFRRGGEEKIEKKYIDILLQAYNTLKKNDDKRKMQIKIFQSADALRKFAKILLREK